MSETAHFQAFWVGDSRPVTPEVAGSSPVAPVPLSRPEVASSSGKIDRLVDGAGRPETGSDGCPGRNGVQSVTWKGSSGAVRQHPRPGFRGRMTFLPELPDLAADDLEAPQPLLSKRDVADLGVSERT